MNRVSAVWILAFAYLVYAAVSDIPALSNSPAFSIVATSFLFIVLYLIHSYVTLGIKTATKYLVIAGVLGYSFEYLFITTGWLGSYVYTADLSPFIGPVPAFIPLLWASLGYFCIVASDSYIVSAVLMVLLDISFDPKFSVTLWKWVPPGQYFGVPVANFVGWFITALAIFLVYYAVVRRKAKSSRLGILFYLLFGIFNGAVPDFVPGLYEAGEISGILFLIAALGLYLYSRRAETKRAVLTRTTSASTPAPPA